MDDERFEQIKQEIAIRKQESSIFDKTQKNLPTTKPEDKKEALVENMFEQAVVHEVANNKELKDSVLDTAKVYTETKMQVIKTNVDTEHKEANFNNRRDACASYGFNEKTTPIWATRVMTWGYNVMLAIWLFVGTFTFMPVIFIAKKMAIGLKHTWLAVIFALIIYLGATFVPILLGILNG